MEVIKLLERAIESALRDKELVEMYAKNQTNISFINRADYIRFLENEERVYREQAIE